MAAIGAGTTDSLFLCDMHVTPARQGIYLEGLIKSVFTEKFGFLCYSQTILNSGPNILCQHSKQSHIRKPQSLK